MIYNVLT